MQRHDVASTLVRRCRDVGCPQGIYPSVLTVLRQWFWCCLYNFDPHKPHFYIVKLGFTGVYIIFLISAKKHRLVLTSTHNLCFDQKYEKISEFLSENFQFLLVKFSVYLNRHVFVMFARPCVCSLQGFYYILLSSCLSGFVIILLRRGRKLLSFSLDLWLVYSPFTPSGVTFLIQCVDSTIFVCVEVLWPSQSNGVMSSAVSLPNRAFTGQA